MKMKKQEALYNKAQVINDFNDVALDQCFNDLEKCDDEVKRKKEIELIKKGLDTRERCHKIERDFIERKAFRRGYIIALVGAVGGALFSNIMDARKK